jgi:hypothetical protein
MNKLIPQIQLLSAYVYIKVWQVFPEKFISIYANIRISTRYYNINRNFCQEKLFNKNFGSVYRLPVLLRNCPPENTAAGVTVMKLPAGGVPPTQSFAGEEPQRDSAAEEFSPSGIFRYRG